MSKDKEIQKLLAISLLDGRNWDKVRIVSDYFSEFALIKYRIRVEVEYLIFLSEKTNILRKLTTQEKETLRKIYKDFSLDEGVLVKKYEAKINHDVKAVEYYLRQKIAKSSLSDLREFIHFGLTSYDINIPAYALMLKEFRQDVLVLTISKLLKSLKRLIEETKSMPMLGRTHGQPALPTTMGKELAVFYQRIVSEAKILKNHEFEAKLTGAVGNLNALQFIAPQIDWLEMSKQFIQSLGLTPNIFTTQIIPYESWLRFFDSLKRLNNILLGFVQDIWWYISFEYFRQRKKEEEVGSSTMSHKINPITFENAEGNLQLANALFEFFVRKLAISRLQRDLSDSTIKRDFGLAFGFTILSWESIIAGLGRVSPNPEKMREDLDCHWEIFSEGVQVYLRSKGLENAYEILKRKTRGRTFTKEEFQQLINELPIKKKDMRKLKINNLDEYLGLTKRITKIAIQTNSR